MFIEVFIPYFLYIFISHYMPLYNVHHTLVTHQAHVTNPLAMVMSVAAAQTM